ncbi:MAG: hypothetical protein JWO69_1021 [Thermoleophilia bacterium]|nr:hypothetical protein [Thermoleophilia bacterium]
MADVGKILGSVGNAAQQWAGRTGPRVAEGVDHAKVIATDLKQKATEATDDLKHRATAATDDLRAASVDAHALLVGRKVDPTVIRHGDAWVTKDHAAKILGVDPSVLKVSKDHGYWQKVRGAPSGTAAIKAEALARALESTDNLTGNITPAKISDIRNLNTPRGSVAVPDVYDNVMSDIPPASVKAWIDRNPASMAFHHPGKGGSGLIPVVKVADLEVVDSVKARAKVLGDQASAKAGEVRELVVERSKPAIAKYHEFNAKRHEVGQGFIAWKRESNELKPGHKYVPSVEESIALGIAGIGGGVLYGGAIAQVNGKK